jgi:CHASE2 domain-containing sensor protein
LPGAPHNPRFDQTAARPTPKKVGVFVCAKSLKICYNVRISKSVKMSLKQTHKKWLAAGVILILSSFLIFLLSVWNPLERSQLNFSNWLYYEHPTKTPIVIVSIGNSSLDENTGLGRNALWPRSYYAQVIENIKKYQPKVVGLDIYFKGKSTGIPGGSLEEILKNQENIKENIAKYAEDQIHPEDQKLIKSLSGLNFVIINSGIGLVKLSINWMIPISA